jgi:hypothetical protein
MKMRREAWAFAAIEPLAWTLLETPLHSHWAKIVDADIYR